jgi:hypothetical protein
MRDDDPPFTEQTAWDQLRVFIEDFASLLGAPAALARRQDFTRREYEVGIAWLRGLEAWLRRLLFIAAARITPPPARQTKRVRNRPNANASCASDDSANWRVSFHLTASKRARRAGARRRQLPRRIWNPVPLAHRFEAVLRAARTPDRYIERAARMLAKTAVLPNQLFHQKLNRVSPLRAYVAQCSLLMLETFPEAWRRQADGSREHGTRSVGEGVDGPTNPPTHGSRCSRAANAPRDRAPYCRTW